jgi:hypothetical protein
MTEQHERYFRTLPWHADELITVDGQRCVYAFDHDGVMQVRFPGGASASLLELHMAGRSVVMPKRMRKE